MAIWMAMLMRIGAWKKIVGVERTKFTNACYGRVSDIATIVRLDGGSTNADREVSSLFRCMICMLKRSSLHKDNGGNENDSDTK